MNGIERQEGFEHGQENPVVLFDGVCNLCCRSVDFIIRHDHAERFRFASLQSDYAGKLIRRVGEQDLPDSMVLVDEHGVHTRSGAAIRVARHLGFPWSLVGVGLILPRILRDPLYSLIAKNRYRWFGRRETCRIPTPELRARFLDGDEHRS